VGGRGVVARGAQILDELGGYVLVQLEFHARWSGSRLSSRANSAA
jgi:hypothetical protein